MFVVSAIDRYYHRMGGRGGFEAYGEAITLGPVVWSPFAVVGPSFSVVRRDRGHCFELAAIASFCCLDGSLFVQEISRQGQENTTTNDDLDGLTLTLLARDGKRYRFPPFIHPFAKPLTPSMEVALKVTVLNRTRDFGSTSV